LHLLAKKQTVSIEWNIVSNPDDVLTENEVVVVPGDVLAEGEWDRVIQNDVGDSEAKNEGESVEKVNNGENDDLLPETPPTTQNETPPANPTQSSKQTRVPDTMPEPEPNTGRGFRSRHKPGLMPGCMRDLICSRRT
jgi:hypothetical protein